MKQFLIYKSTNQRI